jgi:hypothetical protein
MYGSSVEVVSPSVIELGSLGSGTTPLQVRPGLPQLPGSGHSSV